MYALICILFFCHCSGPSGGEHCHTIPDQQNGTWQNSQAVDEEIRHIDPRLTFPLLPFPPPHCTSLPLSPAFQSTLTKCNGIPVILPLPPKLCIYLFFVKNCPLFLVDLKASFFYTKSRLGFYFPISECWNYCIEKRLLFWWALSLNYTVCILVFIVAPGTKCRLYPLFTLL